MKNISAYVITGLSIALLISVGINFYQANKKCPIVTISGSMPKSLPSVPFEKRVDSSGREHIILDREANQQIKEEATTVAARILNIPVDSMAIYYSIKSKNIDGAMVVSFSTARDSLKFLTRTIDSMKRQYFAFHDDYLNLHLRSPSPDDTQDNGDFNFQYNADLRFVHYNKRDKLLGLNIGRRRYFTDISSSDPRMKIKGVEKFTIQRKVPALGLRLQALTSYNWESHSFSTGAGIRLDIGDKFNAGVNYTYSFTLQRWLPVTYAKFDLIQFGR